MEPPIAPIDGVQLLRTVIAHRDYVRLGLQLIAHDLERRALRHDISKLSADEFAGFTRINAAAREHPYGSEEYRAGLKAEALTVALHYSRNDHHPEHTSEPEHGMGFLRSTKTRTKARISRRPGDRQAGNPVLCEIAVVSLYLSLQ